MKRIESSILIGAPASAVWAILTDGQAYPEWNPFITELSGSLAVGERLSVRINPPGGRAMSFRPVVTVAEPERRLEWLGRMGIAGLFDGRHSFVLEAVGSTTTRLVQAEQFSGALIPFTGTVLNRTAAGFAAMNAALRDRAIAHMTTGSR